MLTFETPHSEYADRLIEAILSLETYELVPWEQFTTTNPHAEASEKTQYVLLNGADAVFSSLLPEERSEFCSLYGQQLAAADPDVAFVVVLRYSYDVHVIRFCTEDEYPWVRRFERHFFEGAHRTRETEKPLRAAF